jgi:hypothetical protein
MAMTYDASSQLMNDMIFRGRVKVSSLKFANYIMGEPNATPAHSTRVKWAQRTYQMPDTVAQELTPSVVMQDSVQAQGAAISDTDLQTAVETVINQVM